MAAWDGDGFESSERATSSSESSSEDLAPGWEWNGADIREGNHNTYLGMIYKIWCNDNNISYQISRVMLCGGVRSSKMMVRWRVRYVGYGGTVRWVQWVRYGGYGGYGTVGTVGTVQWVRWVRYSGYSGYGTVGAVVRYGGYGGYGTVGAGIRTHRTPRTVPTVPPVPYPPYRTHCTHRTVPIESVRCTYPCWIIRKHAFHSSWN